MGQEERIQNAYRGLGGKRTFYDGMITCSTLSGRAVCRLVWGMGRAETRDYLSAALSGIPEGFSGRLLEVPVGTGILTMPLYREMPEAEITVEANPNSLAAEHLLTWRDWRVTRVSIGVQSFDDAELSQMGRLHSARQAYGAVSAALAAGFSVSADFIFGLPYQSFANWGRTLREAVRCGLSHISLYQLSLEEGTPWASLDRDTLGDGYAAYRWAQWYLPRKGYRQYEVANFARQGCESRHNINYWREGEYLGAGPGAAGYLAGLRYKNFGSLRRWAAALADGRVVIVFDNSPEVLIAPATINTLFQTADDYYNRWPVATFARIIRYIAAFIAVGLPGFYIAVTCYHREVIPDKLLYAIAVARNQLSFPIVLEVLIMELLFELLREAGIRLPGPMGSTLGIVGGLIIGQAAVDAHIVSPVVVILVALTALSAFTIPNDLFASAFRMIKFYFIAAASIGGFVGLTAAVLTVLTHLSGLKSFGIPYMLPFVSAEMAPKGKWQDNIWRMPLGKMYERPYFTRKGHRRRLRKEKKNDIR